METFDKYETKRTGLTLNDALEAATVGYRVRCDAMIEGSYVYYNFNRFRIQFAGIDGKPGGGSNSPWVWTHEHKIAEWYIFDDPKPEPSKWGIANRFEHARDKWGRVVK